MEAKQLKAAEKSLTQSIILNPKNVSAFEARAETRCQLIQTTSLVSEKEYYYAGSVGDSAEIFNLGSIATFTCPMPVIKESDINDYSDGILTQNNDKNAGSNKPVINPPIRNSRQPTKAEIKTSETKGIALAKKFDQMVAGKPVAEANKIYGNEVNRVMNEEDVYAGFFVMLKIKVARHQLNSIPSYVDERNRTTLKTLSNRHVTNYKNGLAKLPEIPYPNDIPLPGTTWNSNVANNTNQNSGNSNSANTDKKSAEEFYQRGLSLRKECQYQNAVAEFTKAINLDPNNGDYYLERAKANIYLRVIACGKRSPKGRRIMET